MLITNAYAVSLIVLGQSMLSHDLNRTLVVAAVVVAFAGGVWWWRRRRR
jgi:hypothetical protein